MKKIKFNEKLNLNKTIVSQLNTTEQNRIVGGKKDEKTKTGPGVCTAMVTFACCGDKTATGPGVCTALPTFACCGDGSKEPTCTYNKHCK